MELWRLEHARLEVGAMVVLVLIKSKKSKKSKKSILELSQKLKKVHAILNPIVVFADFSMWNDGKVMFVFREKLCFAVVFAQSEGNTSKT